MKNKENRKIKKRKQESPLLNLLPVIDIGNLGYCTLAHNKIAPLLL
jgi:hypothetical protein